MPTQCSPEAMLFARLDRREVVADFDGGAMSSDAGALLLGATDRAIGLLDRLAACFADGHRYRKIAHTRLARATCGTIRRKLLKIGAQVRLSVRRIYVAMASACPYAEEFAIAHARLCR